EGPESGIGGPPSTSTIQLALQPSSLLVFPSSHCSFGPIMPSPQISVQAPPVSREKPAVQSQVPGAPMLLTHISLTPVQVTVPQSSTSVHVMPSPSQYVRQVQVYEPKVLAQSAFTSQVALPSVHSFGSQTPPKSSKFVS